MHNTAYNKKDYDALIRILPQHSRANDAAQAFNAWARANNRPERSMKALMAFLSTKNGQKFDDLLKSKAVERFEASSTPSEATLLRGKIVALEKALTRASEDALDAAKVRELLGLGRATTETDPPKWVRRPDRTFTGRVEAIAASFMGDRHRGAVVDPLQVRGYNAFNKTICSDRVQRTYSKFCEMPSWFTPRYKYAGCVHFDVGDNNSGDIHEELTRTNDETAMQSLIGNLIDDRRGIEMLKEKYGRVWCIRVPGNHARTTKKPESKDFAYSNFDWLLSVLLEMWFKDDPDVKFHCPPALQTVIRIYNKDYYVTHGMEIQGGSGISGVETPIALARHRAREVEEIVGDGFHYFLNGHLHTSGFYNGMWRVGTMMGFDEFAKKKNFRPEPPNQAWSPIDPIRGLVFPTTVFCDKSDDLSPDATYNNKNIVKFS